MAIICKDCGSVGAPTLRKRGRLSLELFLWLCMLVPGVVYSAWRWMSSRHTCSVCGGCKVTDFEPFRGTGGRRKTDSVEKLDKR